MWVYIHIGMLCISLCVFLFPHKLNSFVTTSSKLVAGVFVVVLLNCGAFVVLACGLCSVGQ